MDVGRFGEFGDGPLCRFGPGGDYVREWGGGDKPAVTGDGGNPLFKILAGIADMIGATVDPGILADMSVDGPEDFGPVFVSGVKEGSCDGADGIRSEGDAEAVGDTSADRRVSGQTMLFGDDGGGGGGGRRKSNHRIRAHRKPAKKRVACEVEGQGTLFEIDGIGQSAA